MIHPAAVLGDDVAMGDDVTIGPFVVIGDRVRIGDGCRIDAHAVIGAGCTVGPRSHIGAQSVLYADVHIGPDSVVGAGACIGSDGFGFAWDGTGFRKIPQVGGCRIGERFVAAENATIDRGSIGPTRIGDGVVLGPLSHIGHNAAVGADVRVAALCGIAGSASIGRATTLAQQSATVGHISVGEGVKLEPWSGITQSVDGGAHIAGVPGRSADEVTAAERVLQTLPHLVKRISHLLAAVGTSTSGDENAADHGS